jgi:hypothetical protein
MPNKVNLLVLSFLLLQSSTFVDVLQEAITLDVVAITRVGFQIGVAGLIQFLLSRVYVKYKSWKANDVFFKELAVKQAEIDTLKITLKEVLTQLHLLQNQQNLQQGEVNILIQLVMELIPENQNLKTPETPPDNDGRDRETNQLHED